METGEIVEDHAFAHIRAANNALLAEVVAIQVRSGSMAATTRSP